MGLSNNRVQVSRRAAGLGPPGWAARINPAARSACSTQAWTSSICRQLRLPALVWLALFAAGCDANFPGKPNPKDRPVPADKVISFEVLYGQNCAGCHGKDG